MSWVSLSPVMKMTGTCASILLRLSDRQVSKPSMLGISASIRMTSGVILATIASAWAPSRATSTVIPESSSASVSMRSVSGESSTTNTMSLASLGRMMATLRLQHGQELAQFERIDDDAQVLHERPVLRGIGFDLGQLGIDPADMADLAELDERFDLAERRAVAGLRRDDGWRWRCVGGRAGRPLDVEQSMEFF